MGSAFFIHVLTFLFSVTGCKQNGRTYNRIAAARITGSIKSSGYRQRNLFQRFVELPSRGRGSWPWGMAQRLVKAERPDHLNTIATQLAADACLRTFQVNGWTRFWHPKQNLSSFMWDDKTGMWTWCVSQESDSTTHAMMISKLKLLSCLTKVKMDLKMCMDSWWNKISQWAFSV